MDGKIFVCRLHFASCTVYLDIKSQNFACMGAGSACLNFILWQIFFKKY